MKVYLAGEQFAGVEQSVKRRLFSYWYHQKNDSACLKAYEFGQDLFLDSGAFTAFTKGVDISVDAFAAFIHKTNKIWTCISNLDDTSKNEQKSYDNQKALESLGCKIQPVFHTHEDPKWLAKYLDEGHDYIFIGGMVPETTNWLRYWLDELWHTYLTNPDGTARIKVHGFGLTDQQLMFRYPWFSVDSTSWLFTGSFGGCTFFISNKLYKVVFSNDSPSIKKLGSWHYNTLPDILKKEIDIQLETLGVTAEQCAEHYSYRNVVNAATYQEMESMGTRTFKKQERGIFD